MTFDHEDLQPVEERLRAARPALSPLELDAVKRRVRARTGTTPRRRQPMKSRLTIVAMLVFGGLFSTAGAGLAVSGTAAQNDASVAQYGTPTPTPTSGAGVGGVLPGENSSPGSSKGAGNGNKGAGNGSNGVAGEQNTSGGGGSNRVAGATATQPTRQLEQGAGTSQLPFTGFAAIPVLLLGVALLSAGLVLRRRSAG